MTGENKKEDKRTKEKLEAVGQMIIGEIETIGGILTADPITQAEGEYNLEAGALHRESTEALAETEEAEETDEKEKSLPTENPE
jgi:hypothetical protein